LLTDSNAQKANTGNGKKRALGQSIQKKMNISQEKWVLVQYSAIWIGFPNQYIIMSELDKNIHNSLCVLE
jgi:hypothetical protein